MTSRPSETSLSKMPPALVAWSMWGLGVVFYFIGFYQRVAPAVMTGELMRDFSLDGAALGQLSAYYFYSYVAMQIPTGLLADSWGPRKLLTAGAAGAAAGALLFGLGHNLVWASIGRLLIGGSVAVAFVVNLKLANHWLPPRRFALATGLGLLVGILGAVSAGVPLKLLVAAFGWRPVMITTGLITLVLAVVIWIYVRDDPADRGYQSLIQDQTGPNGAESANPLRGLKAIFHYRNTWFLVLAPGGIVGPILAFNGLWGVPFLKVRFGITEAQAAAICSTMMIAWALGGPLIGGLSDRIGRRKTLYLYGNVAAFLGWIALIYLTDLSLPIFTAIAIITGLASGGMIVSFAYGKESVPTRLAGTVSGVINAGVMIGPMILQPVIGLFLDARWSGQMEAGARVYDLAAYQVGFTPMLVWTALAIVATGLTRETYCQQVA